MGEAPAPAWARAPACAPAPPPPPPACAPAPRLVTFEGGEGVGKSTQRLLLARAMERHGLPVLLTREPGGSPGAEALRALLLGGRHNWAPLAETMLHVAARVDHVERVLRPALAAGRWVLCDRFADSTMAYQGHGQGVDPAAIAALHRLVGLEPALTLVLDADEATRRARLAARGEAPDRYERLGAAFHGRVAEGFRAIAAAEPGRCVLLDARADAGTVHAAVLRALAARWPELGGIGAAPGEGRGAA